jgi:hypothetical protein
MQTAKRGGCRGRSLGINVFKNYPKADAVIYTYGSVIRHTRSSWAFTAQVKGKKKMEDSCAFFMTTSSLTLQVMAVAGDTDFHHCMLP